MAAMEGCRSVVDEWPNIQAPPPPELAEVTVDPATSALLVLDVQKGNCNLRRVRGVSNAPGTRRHAVLTRSDMTQSR